MNRHVNVPYMFYLSIQCLFFVLHSLEVVTELMVVRFVNSKYDYEYECELEYKSE